MANSFESQPSVESTPEQLVQNGIDTVKERYGKNGSEKPLAYHNEKHTEEMINNVDTLVDAHNEVNPEDPVEDQERDEMRISAGSHDRVQLKGPGQNETLSADELDQELVANGYSEDSRNFMRGMIMATVPEFADGTVRQPLTEAKKLLNERQVERAKLFADADLGSFGKEFETFRQDGLNLFYEIRGAQDKSQEPSSVTKEEAIGWFKGQITVLQNHEWSSTVGDKAFPRKKENIGELKSLVAAIDSDEVSPEEAVSLTDVSTASNF